MKPVFFFVCLTIAIGTLGSGCFSECDCAGIAVELKIEDSDGEPVYADAIEYAHNGEIETLSEHNLEEWPIWIGGSSSSGGTYIFYVTVDGEIYESEEVHVTISGPDGCRRPDTQQLTVVIDTDEDIVDFETLLLGNDCA